MSDPDLAQFPLVRKGHAFEDFHAGQVFEHHWGRTLGAGDNALFTSITLAFTPLYFNAEYARAHGHPDVVVHPLLVAPAQPDYEAKINDVARRISGAADDAGEVSRWFTAFLRVRPSSA